MVAADEVSVYMEPRRAMAVLMNVGKPLQTTDNIFLTEWAAMFRESGLRDDASIANFQEACLKLSYEGAGVPEQGPKPLRAPMVFLEFLGSL